jgi:uncharacterized damage-inducible protein DinB
VSVNLGFDELLGYTDHERAKWRAWLAEDPSRLAIPFQAGGRFPTVGSLFDHVFLVERRHLSRLEGATPPAESGVAQDNVTALFEYADLVRADLRAFVTALPAADAASPMEIAVASGSYRMTMLTLLIHMLVHEVRHLAQIAYAVRLAGQEPPGQHDFFYFRELP